MTKESLKVIVAVGAREDIVARASVRLAGTVDEGKVVKKAWKVDGGAPLETKVMLGLADVVGEMADAGVSGAVVIPDRYIPRYLQARKLVGRHNAVDVMMLPWMKAGDAGDAYRGAFKMVLAALRKAENRGVYTPVLGIGETLRRVTLVGCEDVPNGSELCVEGGKVNGVVVVRNPNFYGDVRVTRDGGVVYGELMVESLRGRARSFVEHGREAVAVAYGMLPVTKKATVPVAVAGNF